MDTSTTTFDDILEQLLTFGPSYAGGLSNHGPMAAEALVSLGAEDLLPALLEDQVRFLEPLDARIDDDLEPGQWTTFVSRNLPGLVLRAGSQAGHGLLRVAHAVRSLERADTSPRRRELLAALDYWRDGRALDTPPRLGAAVNGESTTLSIDDVVGRLPRLSADQRREGLLVFDLMTASGDERLHSLMSRLRSVAHNPDALADRFDELAAVAAGAMPRNTGLEEFALLHGVTVPNIARVLIPHLDEDGRAALEAAVVGFVVCAVVAFDQGSDESGSGESDAGESDAGESDVGGPADLPELPAAGLTELVAEATARLDAHYIKLSDAVVGLTARTGDQAFARALASHIR